MLILVNLLFEFAVEGGGWCYATPLGFVWFWFGFLIADRLLSGRVSPVDFLNFGCEVVEINETEWSGLDLICPESWCEKNSFRVCEREDFF